jgi:hypothetical protein
MRPVATAAVRGAAAWRGSGSVGGVGGVGGCWAAPWLARVRCVSGKHDGIGDSARPGLDKTPIVDKLWVLREAIKRTHEAERDLKAATLAPAASGGAIETRVLAPERQQVTYAFSSDAELVSRYLNFYGTIRVGRVRLGSYCCRLLPAA